MLARLALSPPTQDIVELLAVVLIAYHMFRRKHTYIYTSPQSDARDVSLLTALGSVVDVACRKFLICPAESVQNAQRRRVAFESRANSRRRHEGESVTLRGTSGAAPVSVQGSDPWIGAAI